ncbi:MAG: sugar ABC transporter substrate-binding protein, partial [Actinoplanes sp.]
MRTRQRLSLLTVAAMLGVAGCSQGAESTESATEQNVAATTSCASKGELTMWERSGGNKDMVDMLVAAWNTKNPDCAIKLTYIPHTEMVGKI